jgi:hypothetical protein
MREKYPCVFVKCKSISKITLEVRDWGRMRRTRSVGSSVDLSISDFSEYHWSDPLQVQIKSMNTKKIGMIRMMCVFVPAYHPEDDVKCPLIPINNYSITDFNSMLLSNSTLSQDPCIENGGSSLESINQFDQMNRKIPEEILICVEKVVNTRLLDTEYDVDSIGAARSPVGTAFEGREWRVKIKRSGKTIFKTGESKGGAWERSLATCIIDSKDPKDRMIQFLLLSANRKDIIDDIHLDLSTLPGLMRSEGIDYSTGNISLGSSTKGTTCILRTRFSCENPRLI